MAKREAHHSGAQPVAQLLSDPERAFALQEKLHFTDLDFERCLSAGVEIWTFLAANTTTIFKFSNDDSRSVAWNTRDKREVLGAQAVTPSGTIDLNPTYQLISMEFK